MALCTQPFTPANSLAIHSFLTRHASEVKGVLTGFDYVRFRGTLRLAEREQQPWHYFPSSSLRKEEFSLQGFRNRDSCGLAYEAERIDRLTEDVLCGLRDLVLNSSVGLHTSGYSVFPALFTNDACVISRSSAA